MAEGCFATRKLNGFALSLSAQVRLVTQHVLKLSIRGLTGEESLDRAEVSVSQAPEISRVGCDTTNNVCVGLPDTSRTFFDCLGSNPAELAQSQRSGGSSSARGAAGPRALRSSHTRGELRG
jgi:hypothetical protein